MGAGLYLSGATWYLETAELTNLAKVEQDLSYDRDIWHEIVMDWAKDPKRREERSGAQGELLPVSPFDSIPGRVAVIEVLIHAIGKRLDQCTQADKNRVARCLVHEGWKRKREGSGALRGKWFYRPPDPNQGDIPL
jgi:hypothetical protein